ncbi:MAG: hypothetical protein AAF990_07900 [Bacteroidota bacterium]
MKEIIEDHLKEGRLKKAISIFLKWEIIHPDVRNELILHSSRLNSAHRKFIDGLMREEDYNILNNKITLALLNLLYEIERKYLGVNLQNIPKSILVAGTGAGDIPEKEVLIAKTLGTYLGQNNYVLVSGGWQGVDYHVTTAFAEAVKQSERPNLHKRLFQILPKNKAPLYDKGNVFYVNEGLEEWTKSLNLADYVVLIGGVGGTYSTYSIATQERIPVFSFFDTRKDTSQVLTDMIQKWPENIYGDVPQSDYFRRLSAEIRSEEDVLSVIQAIEGFMELIEKTAVDQA